MFGFPNIRFVLTLQNFVVPKPIAQYELSLHSNLTIDCVNTGTALTFRTSNGEQLDCN